MEALYLLAIGAGVTVLGFLYFQSRKLMKAKRDIFKLRADENLNELKNSLHHLDTQTKALKERHDKANSRYNALRRKLYVVPSDGDKPDQK